MDALIWAGLYLLEMDVGDKECLGTVGPEKPSLEAIKDAVLQYHEIYPWPDLCSKDKQ